MQNQHVNPLSRGTMGGPLIANSEEKLKELLDKVVEESKNKGLSINCKRQNVWS